MNAPEHFQLADGYASYRPTGEVTLSHGIQMICDAIRYAREQKIGKLFVDSNRLTGFGPPSTMERFTMGEAFAAAAKSAVKVVVVARPELIDPDRFGMTVARNRGLFGKVFGSEAEAMAWLLDPNAK